MRSMGPNSDSGGSPGSSAGSASTVSPTNAERIVGIIRATMPSSMYEKSGAVLYSGTDTLRAGFAYLMGLNPGGSPSAIRTSIIETINERAAYSSYTHECWRACPPRCEHIAADGRVNPEGLVRHQKNVISLAGILGTTPEQLFSANAVFARSTKLATLRGQTGISLDQWWNHCWAAHKRFLAIVRPRLILTLGYGASSSAFGLLMREFGVRRAKRIGDEDRRGGWVFDAPLALSEGDVLQLRIIGVPHPSYMAVGPDLAKALQEEASAAHTSAPSAPPG